MQSLAYTYSAYALWIILQSVLFAVQFVLVARSKRLSGLREILGWTLPAAKAAAIVINLNSALVAVSKLRLILSLLGQLKWTNLVVITFEKMHRWFGVALLGWSAVHTVAHIINYGRAGNGRGLWLSGTTITGLLMIVLLLLVWMGSWKRVKARQFRLFTATHLLVIPYMALLILHGAFCLLKQDTGKCNSPTSWRWLIGPFILWIVESAFVQWRTMKLTVLKRVIVHPSFVIELQFDKPSLTFTPGQYVFVKIPIVSLTEWHPFTLTSSPHDELHSVHIRVTGRWTQKLADSLHIEYKPDGSAFCHPLTCLPEILIDGPYGHGWTDVVEESFGDGVVVCIGAGIGQTPFASILKTWWYPL